MTEFELLICFLSRKSLQIRKQGKPISIDELKKLWEEFQKEETIEDQKLRQ